MTLPNNFADLIDQYLDGDLGPDAVKQLRAWLEESDANVERFAHQVFVHSQLRETMVAEQAAACIDESVDEPAANQPIVFDEPPPPAAGFWTSLPSVLLFGLLMVAITGTIAYQLGRRSAVADRGQRPVKWIGPIAEHSRAVANLVSVTNCRWDPNRSTADVQSGQVRPGQSLNLLEGVAEIRTTVNDVGTGRFHLEGPLAMMLSSEGMPNIQYGKLAAEVVCDYERFSLDTPLGRVMVPRQASFGVAVTANEVELHVFSGEAVFEAIWPMNIGEAGEEIRVGTGVSLRISSSRDGKFAVRRDQADESRFVTYLSMAASRLDIPTQYVSEIHEAQPVAYWRFEDDTDGLVRNEMSDRFHCRIHGNGIAWRDYRGNRAAEFGVKFKIGDFGCLMSDESLGTEIADDYSVEAWIKPSHFHHGSFFSLIGEPLPFPAPVTVGFLLELQGQVAYPESSWLAPGRIRFLHRNPPAMGGGKSCFSDVSYELRKWQHVIAIKQRAELRLYIDGKLVANGEDPTPLASDLRVLIGQLYPEDPGRAFSVRPFVGELDEVAIYDRALPEDELRRHYELARPDPDVNTEQIHK